MILLIDAGNSCLKWNLRNSGSHELLKPTGKIACSNHDFSEQLDTHWRGIEGLMGVWVANVAGESVAVAVKQWTQRHWNLTPHMAVTAKSQAGVTNAYPDHARLGVDRWLTLLAARRLFPGRPVCIIDCGTAITADLLTDSGQHGGGLIIPGSRLMGNALVQETSAIDTWEHEKMLREKIVHEQNGHKSPGNERSGLLSVGQGSQTGVIWGSKTSDCIRQGIAMAGSAFIRQAITSAKSRLGDKMTVLITGGAAPDYLPALPDHSHHRPDLVLEGLSLVVRD